MLVSAPSRGRRDRIVDRFSAAARHPVTLLLAAAGWGKTVALQQYVASLDVPVVRFDVRPEHGTLLAFTLGLVEAFRDVAPHAEAGVADAVASALGTSTPGIALSEWLGPLVGEFEGAIVLDDFHNAEVDERSAELVAALIERTKPRTRWIVSARSTAKLPVSSWLVYGDAGVPIGEADLRLTPAEALEAANDVHPGSDEAGVARLLAATGGWLTAFDLALRAPEYPKDVVRAAETAKTLSFEYLADQVYGSLTERDRELLLLSSTLPDIDVDVLERAGIERARNLLADLQRRVTFLSVAPADAALASPRRYVCHDLFRAFLCRELEMQGDAAATAMRLRAARALRSAERPLQALPLFTAAGAAQEVLELLQIYALDWQQQGHGDAVAEAIAALSHGSHAEHPVVLACLAMQQATSGKYAAAIPLYERALALTPDPEFAATLVARLALASINAGRDPAAVLESASSNRSLPPALRGELLSLLAMAHGRFERCDRLTAALLDEIESLAGATDSKIRRASILHRLGISAHMLGDVERAMAALSGAAELAVAEYRFRTASTIYAIQSDTLTLNADDVPGALAALASALDFAERSGDRYILRHVTTHWMQLASSLGDADALSAALAVYDAAPGPPKPIDTLPVRGMLAAWEGRFEDAKRAYAEARNEFWLQEDRILATSYCALFAAALGDADRARAFADEALAHVKTRRTPRRSLDRMIDVARSLCALALALSGRRADASRDLRRPHAFESPVTVALRAAVAAIVRDMDDVHRGALEAHWNVLHERGHGGLVRTIEAVLAQRRAESASAVVLTPAELTVLRALERGETPKEIAQAIGCTIHTVRWHIRRAIEKFGCSGRDQAVRAARARGVL